MAEIRGERELDLSQLSIEQLNGIKQQHEAEITQFQQSIIALNAARDRFALSHESVLQLESTAEDGHEILIPLTSSLYVPGRIVDPDRLLIDIGTNYFAEKSVESSKEYLQTRVNAINENIDSIQVYIFINILYHVINVLYNVMCLFLF